MFSPGTRRDFLRIVSASAVSLSALPEWGRAWWFAETTLPRSKDLPKIDGALIFNDEARERMATDIGGNFHRLPVAVLRPRSVEDVPKVVHFANKNFFFIVRSLEHDPSKRVAKKRSAPEFQPFAGRDVPDCQSAHDARRHPVHQDACLQQGWQ